MPVSSVSGALSTSIYFASLFLLLGVLLPPTRSAYDDACAESARHLAGSIADQIDELSPGMTSALQFGSFPGAATTVTLAGVNVTVDVGGASATVSTVWQLQRASLSPGRSYEVTLTEDEVYAA
jgi:hypothetical protein